MCGVPGVREAQDTGEMQGEEEVEEHQWLVGEGALHCALLQLHGQGKGDVLPQTSSPGCTHCEQLGEVEGEGGKELWVEGHGCREQEFL